MVENCVPMLLPKYYINRTFQCSCSLCYSIINSVNVTYGIMTDFSPNICIFFNKEIIPKYMGNELKYYHKTSDPPNKAVEVSRMVIVI